MKKHFLATLLACVTAIASLSSCMTGGNALTPPTGSSNPGTVIGSSGTSTATDVLGSLLGTLIGNALPVNEKSIVGTWVYQSPEVRFESENFLAQAGGEVAAASIEKKLAEIYGTIGIRPGVSGFVFNADKTCTIALGSKAINGTYTVDPANNALNITSSTGLIKLNGKIYFGLNSLVILFEGNKILTIAQALAAFSGQTNSTLGSLSGALSQYKGLMLGMELSKQ